MQLATTSPGRLSSINQLILLFAVMVGVGLTALLFQRAEQAFFDRVERLGAERLELYASTVQSTHRRFDYLPHIMAGDHQVQALLKGPALTDRVNARLETWQRESGASELYLMDRQGVVLASSNWAEPESFVGRNYSFRPYFQDAIRGGRGQFFAVGVTTARPGFFLSRPVLIQGVVEGVAVVKVDMTQLESDWASGGENIWVADHDGIIFLASDPAWKYKSLDPLSQGTLDRLRNERKYSTNKVVPLGLQRLDQSPQGHRIIELAWEPPSGGEASKQRRFLLHSRSIDGLDWTLYYLTDIQGLADQKRDALVISVLTAMLVAVLGLYLASRVRSHQLLEQRVEQRTHALNEINSRLQEEINERRKAEEELRETHEGLVQAEKLAALGQMSAGLVHEINQPLSAMLTFIASTRVLMERNQIVDALANLSDIDSMVRRVTSIVSHLKTFASKSQGQTTRVALEKVVGNALMIMNPRIAKSQVDVLWEPPEDPLLVKADEIKLEQIVVNLLRNAVDAMGQNGSKRGRLEIELQSAGGKNCVAIKDNGCGIHLDDLPKVFDPFFTTKQPGEGLGLGLSVSFGIAREFGGDLEVMDRPGGGSVFKLSLDSVAANGSEA